MIDGIEMTRASTFTLFARVDDERSVAGPEDLVGSRLAVVGGLTLVENEFPELRDSVTVVAAETPIAAFNRLRAGHADFMLGFNHDAYTLMRNTMHEIEPVYWFDQPRVDAVAAVSPDVPLLASILRKALASLSLAELDQINATWDWSVPAARRPVLLTADEQDWLDEGHRVRVRVADRPPWEVSAPEPSGMAVDYLTRIGKRFGIAFDFVPAQETKIEALNDIAGAHRHYDLLPMICSSNERARTLAISEPYLSSPWVIFTAATTQDVFAITDLRGRTVAVEPGCALQQTLARDQPAIALHPSESAEDALRALSSGEVDAYVGNLIVTSHLIQRTGLTPLAHRPCDQAPVARPEWAPRSLIDKGLQGMANAEQTAIQNAYAPVLYEHGIRPRQLLTWGLGISGTAAALIGLVLLWNRLLNQEVQARRSVERELVRNQEQLKQANRRLAKLSETDKLTADEPHKLDADIDGRSPAPSARPLPDRSTSILNRSRPFASTGSGTGASPFIRRDTRRCLGRWGARNHGDLHQPISTGGDGRETPAPADHPDVGRSVCASPSALDGRSSPRRALTRKLATGSAGVDAASALSLRPEEGDRRRMHRMATRSPRA